MLMISFLVLMTSKGPVLFWSKRMGQNNKLFMMPKFRTMLLITPDIATHLITNPEKFITPIGKYLRRTSLDELPQLYSIIKDNRLIKYVNVMQLMFVHGPFFVHVHRVFFIQKI